MDLKSEFLIVAKKLIETTQRSMSPRELVDLARESQLFSNNIAGKTPHQTMKSKLSTHIRRMGENSIFVRTAPGQFYLRDLLDPATKPYDSKPLLPPTSLEKVLVYRRDQLDHLVTWLGINTDWEAVSQKVFDTLVPNYFPRFSIETDNNYTQVLTYILVTKGDRILAYRRGRYNRVEDYLRGSECVGFGGHVTLEDLDLFSAPMMGITNCAKRELNEELMLPPVDQARLKEGMGLRILGILNDESSDVGRRHLAFVMKYEVSDDESWDHPTRGEKSITRLRWVRRIGESSMPLWNYEYWSQLCLRLFAPRLVQSAPSYRIIRRIPLRPPRIICMIGPMGSGKTAATKVLCDDFQYSEINTGIAVANLIRSPDVSTLGRLQFQRLAWDFISAVNGPERLTDELARLINKRDTERIVIDGIRQRLTLKLLKRRFRDRGVGVMFVQTPPDLAYNFYSARQEGAVSVTRFFSYRRDNVEAEVEALIAYADAVIYNWTGVCEYRDTIATMMHDLGIGHA